MQQPSPALVSPAPTDNLSIALGVITPRDWLRQVDDADQVTFNHFLSRRRFIEAFEFLLGHLERTEVTRTRELGPGPTWTAAVDAFECAVDRQQSAQMATIRSLLFAGGVNATAPLPTYSSGADRRRPTDCRDSNAAGSCAPGTPTLTPVPGLLCGHVDELTGLVCVTDAHPRNPGGHYYRSSYGSEVADHHTATEAWED